MLLFFFNDTATTEIYTLSLHDALPICVRPGHRRQGISHDLLKGAVKLARDQGAPAVEGYPVDNKAKKVEDRKSTRLNSSHANISYAVFCLKKKTNTHHRTIYPPTSPLS